MLGVSDIQESPMVVGNIRLPEAVFTAALQTSGTWQLCLRLGCKLERSLPRAGLSIRSFFLFLLPKSKTLFQLILRLMAHTLTKPRPYTAPIAGA